MILFTILALILLLSLIFFVLVASATGAFGIIIFGDVIVCGVIIALIMKHIWNKHSNK